YFLHCNYYKAHYLTGRHCDGARNPPCAKGRVRMEHPLQRCCKRPRSRPSRSAIPIFISDERAPFQFDPQCAEFKSKTKTRAIANDTGDTDRPAGGSELDFHQLAGLKVDPGIELHARAA